MLERFTAPARAVVTGAREEARALGHGWVGTEHMLIAVLRSPEEPGAAALAGLGVTAPACREAAEAVTAGQPGGGLGPRDAEALQEFGIDLQEVRRRTEETFGPGALDAPDPAARAPRRRFPFRRRRPVERPATGHLPFTPRAKKALELSLREAVARKDGHIGVEHVVLALLRSDDPLTRAVWEHLDVRPSGARESVLASLRKAA
jgi:ATP-dependent Clp protease ATP-binding subunit ClpA